MDKKKILLAIIMSVSSILLGAMVFYLSKKYPAKMAEVFVEEPYPDPTPTPGDCIPCAGTKTYEVQNKSGNKYSVSVSGNEPCYAGVPCGPCCGAVCSGSSTVGPGETTEISNIDCQCPGLATGYQKI